MWRWRDRYRRPFEGGSADRADTGRHYRCCESDARWHWNGSDDVLIAWVEVTRREGMSYVVCLSVDIAGRIHKLDDLSLVVTTPSESACKGAKPKP